MKKKISFDYNEEAGLTVATLKTSIGTFYGTSQKHPDDTFHSSYSVGTNIAEARANINMLNKMIADKTIEKKGLHRLINSMPADNEGFKYAVNLYDTINSEIYDLRQKKVEWQRLISNVIEGRKLYLKSRNTDREARDKYLKELGKGIKALSNLSKKDKTD
ncbi:MAG TPA: hypothetical protein DCL29_02220 [Eubacterium sp.]|nr:hypothetical protein [Eubacterium sp.]